MWRRNLSIAWIAQVLSLSGFGFAFPFLPFFIQELGIRDPEEVRFWTGLLASAPALSMAIMAPVWGFLADRVGKKIMMLRAMFFASIIIFSLSLAQSVSTVLILRVAQGLFTGTMTASAALVATGTPRERLGYALGLLSSSNFIGVSIGPLLGGLAAEHFGYRASFMIGSASLAMGFFLVLAFIKDVKHEGVSAGDGAAESDERTPSAESGQVPLRQLFTLTLIASLLMTLILRFVRALPVPFVPLYVQDLRGTIEGAASTTGYISAARGAATALAAVAIARIGDRKPKLLVVALLLAVAGLVSLPIAFLPTIGWFAVLIVVSTFFLGGIEPLLQAEISAQIPPSRRGILFGVQTTIGNLGWFAAPMIGSWISIRFGIVTLFFSLSLSLFPAALIAFLAHRRVSGAERVSGVS